MAYVSQQPSQAPTKKRTRIPKRVLTRLFSHFYRLFKIELFPGINLGQALAKQVAKRHRATRCSTHNKFRVAVCKIRTRIITQGSSRGIVQYNPASIYTSRTATLSIRSRLLGRINLTFYSVSTMQKALCPDSPLKDWHRDTFLAYCPLSIPSPCQKTRCVSATCMANASSSWKMRSVHLKWPTYKTVSHATCQTRLHTTADQHLSAPS